jgi:8-oxo-dGTP pyrophosphatase MutT (NUDIX family)
MGLMRIRAIHFVKFEAGYLFILLLATTVWNFEKTDLTSTMAFRLVGSSMLTRGRSSFDQQSKRYFVAFAASTGGASSLSSHNIAPAQRTLLFGAAIGSDAANQTSSFRPRGTVLPQGTKPSHHRKMSSTAALAATVAASASLAACSEQNTNVTLAEGSSNKLNSSETKCNAATEEDSIILTMPFPEECLTIDTYNGVTVDVSALPVEQTQQSDVFRHLLRQALTIWREEGRRGIWFTIPTSFSHLIPASTDLGFDFQHAEKGRAILTAWLPTDSASRLPHGPTHQVGIGALVLHPVSGKMLVVQEKSGPAAARKLWKMPTGLADPGEDVLDAAVREVKEETGLDVSFDHIVCIRQAHGGQGAANKSDMFFVCQLTLAPRYLQDIERGIGIKLIPQEEEIADAKWVDIEEYFDQEVWISSPLYNEMNKAMKESALKSHPALAKDYSNGGNPPSSDKTGNQEDVVGLVGKRLPVGYVPGESVIFVVGKKQSKL